MNPDRLAKLSWTFKLNWREEYDLPMGVCEAWLGLAYDRRKDIDKAVKAGLIFG